VNDFSDPALDPEAGLLPAGFRDVLPPRAEVEAQTSESLMAAFAAWGYQRVKPPLAEFEETLLSGPGQALAGQTFRFMDPAAQRMLGLRADITVQVSRIAGTRLRGEARPLRLSYAGQVLRTRGSQLRPERQFAQAGFELIGSAAPAADLEVALLAAEAVLALGVKHLSLDFTNPLVVPAVGEAFGLTAPQVQAARQALDHKDGAALAAAVPAGEAATILAALLDTGPTDQVLARLGKLKLPANVRVLLDGLAELLAGVRAELPDTLLTLDLGETRIFQYHSGICFSLFARNVRGELGVGGRYRAGPGEGDEPATGCTLYLDSLMRALPNSPAPRRLYVAAGAPRATLRAQQQQGWTIVQGFDDAAPEDAARRLGCTHVLGPQGPRDID
jgi:ATP phosphoribosyltransferase regulatory subunit